MNWYWDHSCLKSLLVTGIKHSLRKFVNNMKLCGVATLRREGISSRGTLTCLRGGPVWTSWNSTQPSERCCTCVRAIWSTSTGWAEHGWRTALSSIEACRCWFTSSTTQFGSVCSQPRKPTMPSAASKAAWAEGQDFAPLLHSQEIPPAVHKALGSTTQERSGEQVQRRSQR